MFSLSRCAWAVPNDSAVPAGLSRGPRSTESSNESRGSGRCPAWSLSDVGCMEGTVRRRVRDRHPAATGPCGAETPRTAGSDATLGTGVEVCMTTTVRSARQAQLLASQELREAGRTWSEIGQVFQGRYGVNARVALRLAHGWSQREAADRWTERWPDDPKTFKNISYWEQWPARTGYAPSLDVLARLAELYGCHVADLLSDYADHRDVDPMFRARSDLQQLAAAADPAHRKASGSTVGETVAIMPTLTTLANRMEEADVHELARQTSAWIAQFDSIIDRRSLLLKLRLCTGSGGLHLAHDQQR
jgi:transcriptional regulator with XRE-family HTH domain